MDYDRCNRHGGVAFAPLCDEIYDQLVGASQMKYVNANAAFFALMGRIFDDFMQSKAISFVHHYQRSGKALRIFA